MSNRVLALCWPLQMPPTPKAVLISLVLNHTAKEQFHFILFELTLTTLQLKLILLTVSLV